MFQRVGDNLGRHWRDVARFLNLKEAEIDAIEEKTNLKLEEKSFEASYNSYQPALFLLFIFYIFINKLVFFRFLKYLNRDVKRVTGNKN